MLATGHATSGVLVGVVTAAVSGPFGDPAWWAWVAVVAGCAILPDADMKRSVVDELWGPFTRGIRLGKSTVIPGLWSLVRPLLGGHRVRSHRIEGVLVFLAGIWVATHWVASSAVIAALATGLSIRSAALVAAWLTDFRYRRSYWIGNAAASAAVGWWVLDSGAHLPGWLPFAMAFGCAVHIAGDMVTDSGVQLTFAFPKKARLLPEPLCFKAGGWVEHAVVMPVLVIATGIAIAYQAGYDPIGTVLTAWRSS
jgi:hypothetical protein